MKRFISLFLVVILASAVGFAQMEMVKDSVVKVPGQDYSDVVESIIDVASLDDDDDGGKGQTMSGLLSSSADVFNNAASFNFSSAFFKIRGYDSEYGSVYMNGLKMNNLENGRAVWSYWSGLNDVTRNKIAAYDPSALDFTIGNIAGATDINLRASKQRKQAKLTYSWSDRTYNNRVMLTYSTGLLNNGWAFSLSGSWRQGTGGYVEATTYNSWAYFAAAEKQFGKKRNHSLSLAAFGTPTRRGSSTAATMEVYDMMGKHYNPNWGWQDGKMRNSREKHYFLPTFILNYDYAIRSNMKLNVGFGYLFGVDGSTALNWYNSADPRPDYYRNLPSYQTNPMVAEMYRDSWMNDESISQVNWDKMYQTNYNRGNEGGRYMVEDRITYKNHAVANAKFTYDVLDNVRMVFGVDVLSQKNRSYKTVDDLLGATYWLDINQFAERDVKGDTLAYQNDVLYYQEYGHAKKAEVGDKFGYDYAINTFETELWAQVDASLGDFDLYAGVSGSITDFYRQGYMMNGLYMDSSYGKSDNNTFLGVGGKIGGLYKITGRHFVDIKATYYNRAPNSRNAYLSPRIKDETIANLYNEKIYGIEASYIIRYPKFSGRVTGYYTQFQDQTDLMSFYHDDLATFVNYAMSNISKTHAGLELGLEYKPISSLSIYGAMAYGDYKYSNNPTVQISAENKTFEDTQQTTYLKGYYAPGVQWANTLGIKWQAPKYWYLNINGNYYDKIYLSMNPERRTSGAIAGLDPNNPTDMDAIQRTIQQNEAHGGFSLDASIGKSFRIVKKYFVNINLSCTNILNNTNIVSGGYEQLRFDYENKNPQKFPEKYFFMYGRTFFVNATFRF